MAVFHNSFSNSQNETVQLKVYSTDDDEVIDAENSFVFANDEILGTPSEPFAIDISIPLGTLIPPENVIIEVTETEVILTWNVVNGANSYKILASENPESDFEEIAS